MAGSAPSTGLLSLPLDILIILPEYLRDIEDHKNLSSTCRTLRIALSDTSPQTILRLCSAASNTFFRPSPYFLVAACARQLSTWARSSPASTTTLTQSFRGGIDALLDLCLAHSGGLTMARVRELHALRFSVINLAVDLIDKCVGAQWVSTPDFWDGGVDDALTLDVDPSDTFFHLVIYGELFAGDFDVLFSTAAGEEERSGSGDTRLLLLGLDARLEYVKYCIPDWASYHCQNSARDVGSKADGTFDSRRNVNAVGPYSGWDKKGKDYSGARLKENQIGLGHLLRSNRWSREWKRVREVVVKDFDEPAGPPEQGGAGGSVFEREGFWKQHLWEAMVLCQGMDAMRELAGIDKSASEAWAARLKTWRNRIAALEEKPAIIQVGRQPTYAFPDLQGDIWICSSGYFGGS